MSRKYIQDGSTMSFVTAGAIANDEVVELTNGIGIALAAATGAAQTIEIAMDGVFELAKETGVAFTQGQKLYWDAVNNRLDATNTNIPAGLCWKAAASGDVLAQVKINAGAPV